MREISGAGKSVRQVADGWAHMGSHPRGKHVPRGIDFRSYDSESTLTDENNGPPGVPGVAGADAVGVPTSDSGILFSQKYFFFLKKGKR